MAEALLFHCEWSGQRARVSRVPGPAGARALLCHLRDRCLMLGEAEAARCHTAAWPASGLGAAAVSHAASGYLHRQLFNLSTWRFQGPCSWSAIIFGMFL